MVNEKGRPKKYENRIKTHFSSSIPEHFRETFKKIEKLSNKDINEEFKKYCSDVEREDLTKKGQGKLSVYIRWILTNHVIKNAHKLTIP